MFPIDANSPNDAWATAILLHPHPDRGGNRFNVVVDSLYRALPAAGVAAMRFDFSSSDMALAAQNTVEVIDTVATRPLVLVGYSFGAAVAATVNDERLAGWFLVAPPLRQAGSEHYTIAADPRPKALALAELDQFFPRVEVLRAIEGWINTEISVVPSADHFFARGLDGVVAQVLAWLRSPAIGSAGRGAEPLSG